MLLGSFYCLHQLDFVFITWALRASEPCLPNTPSHSWLFHKLALCSWNLSPWQPPAALDPQLVFVEESSQSSIVVGPSLFGISEEDRRMETISWPSPDRLSVSITPTRVS